ncbi:SWIB/MDM2 domain superfamily protein [Forsythia ovata]|uniref:SWIB/MDM2 domain superfamily protein n=1 Tax=Forsythia ovata TaxID=205694 RepID=A0ABD1VHB8_9LAMI
MSTPSRFFRGCRALFYAHKSAAPAPTVSSSKKNPTTTTAAASSKAKKKKPPSPTAGILKSTPVSPALQSLVGAPEISRAGAVKKVWEYIKLHNLQNPNNKKEIYCDAKLKSLFEGKDKVGFLEIGKLLSNHFVKAK